MKELEVIIEGKKYVDELEFKKKLIRLLDQDIDDANSVEEKNGLEYAQQRIWNM